MKPKTNPSEDSLVSGINIPVQNSNQANVGIEVPSQNFQSTPIGQDTTSVDNLSPFQQPESNPQTFNNSQPPQPFNSPLNPPESLNPLQTPDVSTAQPPQPIFNQEQNPSQTTSSLDPPPAPASQPQPAPAPVNLGSAVVTEKPKRKLPFFLLFLLILVVIVLGAVGYLAYQNYKIGKNIAKVPNVIQPTLQIPPTVGPNTGYINYLSKILPVEFMIPDSWTANETQDKVLADQKVIDITSPDFSYSESSIAAGFEFKVGPVNNLTKKYESFDAFAAEENTQNLYSVKVLNGKSWLVKGNEAKTLINSTPLTVALYSSSDKVTTASEIFNKIMDTFKILTVSPTTTITPPASPSATPLE